MPLIRAATEADAPALLEIYRPFVETTTISFETETPGVAEFAERISRARSAWSWLVAEADGRPVGYAYGSRWRERRAYRWSVEVSAYVHPDHQGRGIARALYRELCKELAGLGYCNAYAGITLPNEPSVAFHERFGFDKVGVFRRAGWKFGAWHDVAWYQYVLRDEPPPE